MTRRTAKKKDTLTGLRREVKDLAGQVEFWRQRLNDCDSQLQTQTKRGAKYQAERDTLAEQVLALKLENAELHGYINRVEIEDDKDWYGEHGAKVFSVQDAKEGAAITPPLRQRRCHQNQRPDTTVNQCGGPRTRFAG